MSRNSTTLPVLFFFLILFLLGGCGGGEDRKPPTAALQQPAPTFSLVDDKGRTWNLEELRGKVVFLNFWATWCPPCREEMPSMVKLNAILADKPFVMLTVLVNDDVRKAENFLADLQGSLPILADTDGRVGAMYGLTGVPETFIIDKEGILQKKYIGAFPWDSDGALEMLKLYL
ncbi:MAG: TlpA disulfide reductase family protein [Thermodesulfobacteriota bacterium]